MSTFASAEPKRASGLSLGLKLAALCAVLTVVVVGGALLFMRQAVVRDVRGAILNELEESQRGWRALQEQRLTLLLSTSALVATSPTLRAALATSRSEGTPGEMPRQDLLATIQREAERVFADLDRDLMLVLDQNGKVLAGVSRGNIAWAELKLNRLPAVTHALNDVAPTPDSSFAVVQLQGGTVQLGCAAILVAGYPVGVLVLGDRLERVVPHRESTASMLVVTAGDEILESNVADASSQQLAEQLQAIDSAEIRPLTLGKDEFVAATLPLGTTPGGAQASVHLLRSVSVALGPLDRTLTRSFLLAGLMSVLLVGIGAVVVSRGVLAPLSHFVDFLRDHPQSGRPARAEPGAAIEVRTLIDAYNRQNEAIAEQHTSLAQANKDLRGQIEERERAEHALRQSEAALRQAQKLEALGRLASGVAHDFNNLLQVISGATHFLRQQIPTASGAEQDLADIEGASQRATALVRQLLAFSRKQVLQPRILALNEVIVGIEPLMRRLCGSTVSIVTTLAPDLTYIRADPGQVEQVLMNLVVNAVDAMPIGGTIEIHTANVVLERAYEQRPEALPGGPAVMLSVSDTGIGMDADTRSRIFEPFFTTKAPGKGTGLGLATVYGVVRQSGGNITVFSEPGEGTTFRLYFPVAETGERFASNGDTGKLPNGTETILIAEDEEPVRRQVRRFLETCGYTVLEAASGLDAMETALQHEGPIHLLVADLAMPGVSGIELARRLRFQREDLRAILLSGYMPESVTQEVNELGWATHLSKPAEPVLVARTIRKVLDEMS